MVSIHAPARGATSLDHTICRTSPVSIHAPARGATPHCRGTSRAGNRFNPRAREGRDLATSALPYSADSFNPRAREGRDPSSTNSASMSLVFQSTRPRGARRGSCRSRTSCRRFNPRAREGRDHDGVGGLLDVAGVSIHAPVRGATSGHRASPDCHPRFNPRAREGRDSASALPSFRASSFNPRAREGRDQAALAASQERSGFNPRAREGRDGGSRPPTAHCKSFQSTRPRGARLPVTADGRLSAKVSIHAPARGATRLLRPRHRPRQVSIHAPARGATSAAWGCRPCR